MQYQNATIIGGFLRGPGAQTLMAGSTNSFNATTINTGATVQQNGSAAFIDVTNVGQLNNNAPLTWDGGLNNGGGTFTISNTATVSEWNNAGVIVIPTSGVLNNHETDLTSYGGGRIMVNSGGTLNADSQGEGVALDLQDSLLTNNGTVAGTTNVNYGATVAGSGSFGLINVNYGGTLAIDPRASPVIPALTVSSGSISGAGQSVSPAIVADATITTPSPTDTLRLSGNFSGAGPLTKNGAGLLILSGTNSYGGGTIVTAGTLEVTSSNALPDVTILTVGAGGTFIFDPSQAGSPVALSAASQVNPGYRSRARSRSRRRRHRPCWLWLAKGDQFRFVIERLTRPARHPGRRISPTVYGQPGSFCWWPDRLVKPRGSAGQGAIDPLRSLRRLPPRMAIP